MNSTVTLSQLITRLAKVAGTDIGTARRFLRSFFASVEEALLAGETVTIKGIGVFRRNSDEAFNNAGLVVFIPDNTLADEVNAPFAMFEPVELADDVDFSEVAEEKEPEPEPLPEPQPAEEPQSEPEPEPLPEPGPTEEPQPEPVPEPEPEPELDDYAIELGAADDEEDEGDEAEDEEAEEQGGKSRLWLWIVLGLLAGALAGYFAAVYEPGGTSEEEAVDDVVAEDVYQPEEVSVEDIAPVADTPEQDEPLIETAAQSPAPSQPEKAEPATPAPSEPRYDTVSGTRYLATMAREYYGRGIYWVFIYQANADHLADPNRIKPGTRVLIPEKSSFAEATDKETLRKAERIQAELNKKYK